MASSAKAQWGTARKKHASKTAKYLRNFVTIVHPAASEICPHPFWGEPDRKNRICISNYSK
jgi:hypothetical protein